MTGKTFIHDNNGQIIKNILFFMYFYDHSDFKICYDHWLMLSYLTDKLNLCEASPLVTSGYISWFSLRNFSWGALTIKVKRDDVLVLVFSL